MRAWRILNYTPQQPNTRDHIRTQCKDCGGTYLGQFAVKAFNDHVKTRISWPVYCFRFASFAAYLQCQSRCWETKSMVHTHHSMSFHPAHPTVHQSGHYDCINGAFLPINIIHLLPLGWQSPRYWLYLTSIICCFSLVRSGCSGPNAL